MTKRLGRWFVLWILALLPACSDSGSRASEDAGLDLAIRLEADVSLGSIDAPVAPTNLARVTWWERMGFVVAPVHQPGVLGLYDAAGDWVRSLGRQGDGPGEFTGSPVFLVRTSAGSLWVNSVPRREVAIFAVPEEAPTALPLPGPILGLQPIGSEAFLYAVPVPGDTVLVGTREGSHIGGVHFPKTDGEALLFGVAPRGAWIASREPFTLLKVDSRGTPLNRISRPPDWLPALTVEGGSASVHGIWEDEHGLWVVALVRDPNDPDEDLADEGDWDDEFDTVIELLDPESGETLDVLRDDRALYQVYGRSALSQTVNTEVGDIEVRLYTLSVNSR